MLNQNDFTGEDVRVPAKQFGLGEKGTVNTRNRGQHLNLSSTTLVLEEKETLHWAKSMREL